MVKVQEKYVRSEKSCSQYAAHAVNINRMFIIIKDSKDEDMREKFSYL